MTGLEILGLSLSAAAAGVINAIAGGGTLVTFPTLLYFGTSPIVANATSTLALVIGTSGSVYGYRSHLGNVQAWLLRFIPASVVGGLIGSILLTRTSEKMFSKLVPFLILFATLLFLGQGFFRRTFTSAGADDLAPLRPAKPVSFFSGAVLFQFVVAIYGGYFGAGIGILMLSSLGFAGFQNIHEMNTIKTVLGSLINLVAALWFVAVGLIHWPQAIVMTVGAVAGYYLGSHFAQRISQNQVRACVTLIGFAISAATFYKEFLAP